MEPEGERELPRTAGKKKGKLRGHKKSNPATPAWAPSTTGVLAQVWHSPEAHPVSSLSRKAVLRSALTASASGTPFEDINFFAFSRRSANGLVDTPMPLLANSALVRKASSHFDYLFTQGFAESNLMDMDGPYPPTRRDRIEDYVYDSDSDLEDEIEDTSIRPGGSEKEDSSKTSVPGAAKVSCYVAQRASGWMIRGLIDKEGMDSEDEGPSQAPAIIGRQAGDSKGGKPGRIGRVIFIDDFAYKTWKAFLLYAYLGETELVFAPLRSEQKPRPPQLGQDRTPLCSPKSMYRLAEKYDITPLKKQAADAIQKGLSPSNILEEAFSTFSSLYPEIRTMEVEYLHANVQDQGIRDRLPTWIVAMEGGHLPEGAAAVVVELISKLLTGPTTTPGMKRCPGGCSTSTYHCDYCDRSF
ncbi:hypothetical protein C8Q78DRAFT_964978 [Trametes maxima]|nr:hypothetical protein C8Q78DRAFT_964978 [Trametes maxima]